MSFGTIFLILAVGILGLITLSKLKGREPDPKPVRGDDLAVWPFAPMPIMTDTEVIFLRSSKPPYQNIMCLFRSSYHESLNLITARRPNAAFGSIESVVKAWITCSLMLMPKPRWWLLSSMIGLIPVNHDKKLTIKRTKRLPVPVFPSYGFMLSACQVQI